MSDTRPVITIPTSALDALSADARDVLRNALRPITAREQVGGVDASIVRLTIMQRYGVPQATRIEAVTALYKAIRFAGATTAVPPSVRVRIEESRPS